MSNGIVLGPGASMTFSMALPDFSSKEGQCWNPDCDHMLSWGTRGNGKPDGWAEDCPYCGWTAAGAPTDPKWMKKRWPSRYGRELRARIHGASAQAQVTVDPEPRNWFTRLLSKPIQAVKQVVCDHDWVEVGEAWWSGNKPWTSYFRLPDLRHENVICDKCHELGVRTGENHYSMVGGGFTDVPRRWFWNKGDQLNIPIAKHPNWTSEEEGDRLLRAHPRFRDSEPAQTP